MRQSAVDQRHLTLGQQLALAVMINLEFSELVERLRAEARERQIKSGEVYGRGKVTADLQEPITNKSEVAEQIAQLSGTSPRNVYKAQAVIREAPDLAERVKSGEITINKAESELKNHFTSTGSNTAQ